MLLSVRGEVSLDIFRKCLVISVICLEPSAMFRAFVIAVSENKAGGIGALIPLSTLARSANMSRIRIMNHSIRLYRKCVAMPCRSIGYGPAPRWISD